MINAVDSSTGSEEYQTASESVDMFGEEAEDVKQYKSSRDLEKFIKDQLDQISMSLEVAQNEHSRVYTPDSGIDPYNVPENLTKIIIGNNFDN